MKTPVSNPLDSWGEADQLISILRNWGISYLVGEDHPVSPSDLGEISKLLSH